MYKYLEVKETGTPKVIFRMCVAGKSERTIEKIEKGMLINMDTEKYHTNINNSILELELKH